MKQQLSLYLLGTFAAELDGEAVQDFGYDKVRALLAYLAMQPELPQRRDVLAGLLWPEDNDRRARHSLSQALLKLRRALGEQEKGISYILADHNTIQIHPEAAVSVDANRFFAHLEVSAGHDHGQEDACAGCVTERQAAVALYRGEFLEGLAIPESSAFEEWVTVTRERVQRRAVEALQQLAQYYEAQGDWQTARRYAQQQVGLEPWREEAHRQLMLLMARNGDYSAALAQYEACREVLQTELGVEPMAETEALYQRIREVRRSGRRGQVPSPITPLIGREHELASLRGLLVHPQRRLITIAGPPGIGKTRLALAAAEENADAFLEGVAFVRLEPVSSGEALIFALANALDIMLEGADWPRTQLLTALSRREVMLVLDGFEHLISEVSLLQEILEAAPQVTLLATSRERLRLPGEWVMQLEGLEVPADAEAVAKGMHDFSATRLFLERCQQAQAQLALTGVEAGAVADICRLVEGMPLAIELAAAQVQLQKPSQIRSELEHNLDVLDTSRRGPEIAQSSMSAVLYSAWQRLEANEQQLLARLSVFRGGCTREAAREVAEARDAELTALLDKSLLRRSATGRLEMHALIRMFAYSKLTEAPEDRERTLGRHAEHTRALLGAALARWRQSHDAAEMDAIGDEMDNVRAGWTWILKSGRWDDLAGYMDDLWQFFKLRRRLPEAIEYLETVLEASSGETPAPTFYQARWTRLLGEAHLWLSRLEQGEVHFRRTLALLDWPIPESGVRLLAGISEQLGAQLARSLLPRQRETLGQATQNALREGVLAYERLAERAAVENETARSVYCAFRALNLAEASGQAPLLARAYSYAGYMCAVIPLRSLAESYLNRADANAEADGSLAVRTRVSWWYSLYLTGVGRWEEARAHALRSAEAAGLQGEHWVKEVGWVILLTVAYGQGRFAESLAWARRIGASARERDDAGFVAAALYWEAILNLRQEDVEKVLALLEEAAGAPAKVMNRFDWILVRAAMAEAHLRLGDDESARREADQAAALIAAVERPAHCVSFPGYCGVADVYLTLWESATDEKVREATRDAAKKAIDSLKSFARIFPTAQPRAALLWGRYQWLEGRAQQAQEAWQQSLKEARALKMPFEEGLAHYEIGRRGASTSLDDAKGSADSHLQKACTLFEELGVGYDLARARHALAKKQSNPPA